MKRVKSFLNIALCVLLIGGLTLTSIISKPIIYSYSERRALAQAPAVNKESLLSGKFTQELEDYSLDQFPLRDSFRGVKAFTSKYILMNKENNGLYTKNGYISRLEYPMSSDKVRLSAGKLNEAYEQYIKGTACKMYLSIIPDKNYFLAPLGNYPTMDYDELVSIFTDTLSYAEYIDIFGDLELDDFYKTDQHWRQEKIVDVAEKIASSMGARIDTGFTDNELDKDFYGAYSGQLALRHAPDRIHYLTNDALDKCTVTSFNTGVAKRAYIYDMDKAMDRDSYEMFLSGSDAMLVIENPNAATDKELVVFRDSFASSLLPLITSGYSKITVVDLRYISLDLVPRFVEFNSQDVLFLYSTLVINNNISK